MSAMSVLLTDGQQRKTLAAARSLGQMGHRVLVADDTRFSTTRFSRWCFRGLLSPSPGNADRYWEWVLDTVQRFDVDLYLPMDDQTTALAVSRRERLPCRTLLPTPEQFAAGADKLNTADLAARSGVRAPRTVAVSTETEAVDAARTLNWQAVLKARRSSGGRGVFRAENPEQVKAAWARANPDWGGFIVQERVNNGRKYDVCLLFGPAGDLRASFVQEELRWFPLEHGTSTLQESVSRPDLVSLACRLLAPIGWRGPVEVEFMEDEGGAPVLMEVNPRFWASLALAVRCGVDFPALAASAATGGDARGPGAYPVGVRCRWLLPGDLLHFVANPDRFRMEPGLLSTYDHRTFDDIISRDDPGPAFGFALAAARFMWDPRMWRWLLRW